MEQTIKPFLVRIEDKDNKRPYYPQDKSKTPSRTLTVKATTYTEAQEKAKAAGFVLA